MIEIFSDQNDLVSCDLYPYAKFPYDKFNPVQSRAFDFFNLRDHCLAASKTSSGKTILSELFAAQEIRANGKKALYISPQKSLAQEKYSDWTNKDYHFSDLKICICTGDYRLTPNRKAEIDNSDLLIMTSEMLGSRCRNYRSENNQFLKEIKTVIFDECFVGSTNIKITPQVDFKMERVINDERITHVMSYDENTGQVVQKKILRKITHEIGDKKLVSVKHQYGEFTCTHDHKIWTTIGYVKAGDLTTEHKLKWIPTEEGLKCQICKKSFTKRCALMSHYIYGHMFKGKNAKHTKETKLCSKCGKEISVYGYDGHFKSCGIEKKKYYTPKSPICSKCGKVFKNAQSRQRHEIHHNYDKEYYKKKGEALANNPVFKESVKQMGKRRMGENNPIFRNPESYAKFKKMGTIRWQSLTEQEKLDQINRFINAPLKKTFDTILEFAVVEAIGELPIKKTSGGLFWLTFKNGKRKNPDFKINEQKKVIEVGDTEYWHTLEEISETVKKYKEIGYDCLYLTDKDVKEGIENLRSKIIAFLENHTSEVISVANWGGKVNKVYDIEVEDCHNYFANGTLVSNCHMIGNKDRGDKIETAMMKFTEINPDARFVMLSATLPNIEEISEWISSLTRKKVNIIRSEYRPCPLNIHFPTYRHFDTYDDNENSKVQRALDCIEKFSSDKFIAFVHSKRTGELMLKRLRAKKIICGFHNADLNASERIKLENSFKNDPLFRVLVSTSSMAVGNNCPARRVVILGVHCGREEVSSSSMFQMAGRSGRPQYDPQGDAYVLLPDTQALKQKERILKPLPITSQLSGPYCIAFHIISEIHHRTCRNIEDLEKWYYRSFSYHQRGLAGISELYDSISMLEKNKCIKIDGTSIDITGIGAVSSMFYYHPFDASALNRNMKKLFNLGEMSNEMIAFSLACIPGMKNEIPTLNERDEIEKFYYEDSSLEAHQYFSGKEAAFNGEAKAAYNYWCLLMNGMPSTQSLISHARGLKSDFERISEILSVMDDLYGNWGKKDFFNNLKSNIVYGVSAELMELVQLDGIGRVKAQKLYDAGIKSLKDVVSDPVRFAGVLKSKSADKLVEQAKKLAFQNQFNK